MIKIMIRMRSPMPANIMMHHLEHIQKLCAFMTFSSSIEFFSKSLAINETSSEDSKSF